jgi:zinc protease
MKALIISILLSGFIMAQQVVELKQPNSSKIVVKFMFKNGSVCDPQGKEGLTYTTSQLINQGGTGKLTFSDIQDKIYPMAASYFSNVDKEVTIFTFMFHKDWLEQFYPIMMGLITNPS